MNISILTVIFTFLGSCYGANILFLNSIASPSHHIFNYAIAEGLALKGHNVTYVSPDLSKNVPDTLHQIHLEKAYEVAYGDSDSHLDLIAMAKETSLESLWSFYTFGEFTCRAVEESRNCIKTLLSYPDDFKFDLVLHDFTCGPCILGVIKKFKYPPVIGVSAFNNPPYTVDIVGGSKLGLTASPFYTLYYDTDMNIFQRLHNGMFHFVDSMYRKYVAIPEMDSIIKRIFGPDSKTGHELDQHISIALVNSHPSIDFADSLPPNIIEVGGLQIKNPKPLPEDVKKFIESSKKGTLIMSLGTNIKSDMMTKETLISIIETFKELPQYNFIWKFESDSLPIELPKNVMIRKWLPQNDILAHPKIVGFISHLGLLSLHETLWWGKPVIAIPFIADQHRNTNRAVISGFALKIDFQKLNKKIFKETILEVLMNPKYRHNIEKKSKRFRDQKENPLDRAIWWCEYILRDPNPDHLRSQNVTLGLLGPLYLDFQIILLIVIAILFGGIYCGIQKIKRTLFSVSVDKKNN